jgi:phospholipid transport system substrate-binding protein
MKSLKFILIFFLSFLISNISFAKNPSDLINEIVDEASKVLSSNDPVESKIIKLNDIAERSVDINGIGMYTLGKYRKSISE